MIEDARTWLCPQCDTVNESPSSACVVCGVARGGGTDPDATAPYQTLVVPTQEETRADPVPTRAPVAMPVETAEPEERARDTMVLVVAAVFLVGLIAGVGVFALASRSRDTISDSSSALRTDPTTSASSSITAATASSTEVPTTATTPPVPASAPVTASVPPVRPAPSGLPPGFAVRLGTAKQGVPQEESDIHALLDRVKGSFPNAAIYSAAELTGRVDIRGPYLVLLIGGYASSSEATNACAAIPTAMKQYGCGVDSVH
jgi:hypothetical protein